VLTLRDGIVELYKKVATSIPKDVEDALKAALQAEADPARKDYLAGIMERIITARTTSTVVCEDTGFPVFYVRIPKGLGQLHIREVITEATRTATRKIPLKPNAVNTITEENSGDNVGDNFPLIYVEESPEHSLVVDLMLRGGNCENLGRLYGLPARFEFEEGASRPRGTLQADRDFEGVRQCVLDAVSRAKGLGCPPFTLGIALGGARDHVTYLSKRQLLRRTGDTNPQSALAQLEGSLMEDLAALRAASGAEVPPVIGVKVGSGYRHPDSYFVDVSFSCWANRRGRLIW
jgi:fumarate hydratase class I